MEQIPIISMWRNDMHRKLEQRTAHLLSKTSRQAKLRWIWIVGDSTDGTEDYLRSLATTNPAITVLRRDTGIMEEDPYHRIHRGSLTLNGGFDLVTEEDTKVLHHESDLMSPVDLVDRFLDSNLCPVAGWPTLAIENPPVFYDTWAYRGPDGTHFSNHPPYHWCYTAQNPFRVNSVGSCWMFFAQDIRDGVRCYYQGVVELSQKFRDRGQSIWVLPDVPIEQPVAEWVPQAFL